MNLAKKYIELQLEALSALEAAVVCLGLPTRHGE
jgi:hypothetical protein